MATHFTIGTVDNGRILLRADEDRLRLIVDDNFTTTSVELTPPAINELVVALAFFSPDVKDVKV